MSPLLDPDKERWFSCNYFTFFFFFPSTTSGWFPSNFLNVSTGVRVCTLPLCMNEHICFFLYRALCTVSFQRICTFCFKYLCARWSFWGVSQARRAFSHTVPTWGWGYRGGGLLYRCISPAHSGWEWSRRWVEVWPEISPPVWVIPGLQYRQG